MKKIKTIKCFGILFIIIGVLIVTVGTPLVYKASLDVKERSSNRSAYGIKLTEDNLEAGKIDKEYADFMLSTFSEKEFIVDNYVDNSQFVALLGVLVILLGTCVLRVCKYKRKYNQENPLDAVPPPADQ